MRRFGQVIGIRPQDIERYKKYHDEIWPEISAAIHEAGIRNYSIFYRGSTLFAFYEYVEPDEEYAERMAAMARAPRMREWWDIMEAMQVPVDDRTPGEWWANMREVFRLE